MPSACGPGLDRMLGHVGDATMQARTMHSADAIDERTPGECVIELTAVGRHLQQSQLLGRSESGLGL